VDVPADLESFMFDRYASAVLAEGRALDRDGLAFAYAALGAQRATKILGIFARLARRDGKTGYLAHLPRIWRYLARDLAHPELAALQSWYAGHLPPDARHRTLEVSHP
jgi:aminoglycoside/choline kinase family phosphotransferase